MTERAERAQRLHDKGYNCAQAVVCAYCDRFGLDENTAFKMAEGFGLGMGLMEVCGALTGAEPCRQHLCWLGCAAAKGQIIQARPRAKPIRRQRRWQQLSRRRTEPICAGSLRVLRMVMYVVPVTAVLRMHAI